MNRLLSSQKGITLIETIASTAIVAILLLTVLGALLFGQKMIVISDEKNNAAASAQEIIDSIMISLSNKEAYTGELVSNAQNMGTNFDDTKKTEKPKQYYITPVDKNGNSVTTGSETAYQVYVRVYYNQGESHVDLSAFAKRGGV